MGLFGFGKRNKQPTPAPKQEPKQPEISGPPHQYFIMVDGQWYVNPDYDPSAPKPEPIKIYGLDDDEDKEDNDE